MTQQIVILSGKKQSGKTSASNFLHGLVLQTVGVTRQFTIAEDGRLEVLSAELDDEGKIFESTGFLDVDADSPEFSAFASQKIWPYIKSYSYADLLKSACMSIFGLTREQCYGSNDDKDSPTNIKWADMAWAMPPRTRGDMKKKGLLDNYMTAREFMEEFGTRVCRKIRDDCWVRSCMDNVVSENVPLAIITDGRFPNEMELAGEYDAITVRFARDSYKSESDAETALDHYKPEDYDIYIDNNGLTLTDKHALLLKELQSKGLFEGVTYEP